MQHGVLQDFDTFFWERDLDHIWGIYTFVPFVFGKGEFRNSSVNLAQLSALLRSEWIISLS